MVKNTRVTMQRHANLMLLNDEKQEIQRMMGLKRRFMRSNKFFQDYTKFINNLFGISRKIHQQGIAIRTRFDKSDDWCLETISQRKNCLRDKCRIYLLSVQVPEGQLSFLKF